MLVLTVSYMGAGLKSGRVKVLKCLKCGKQRMVFNLLAPQLTIQAGDTLEGDIVLQFVGKSMSQTGIHFWSVYNEFEKLLLPSGYVSWGLPFVFREVAVVPKELNRLFRLKYGHRDFCEFTTDYPYAHTLQIMYKSVKKIEPEPEAMCPECYRALTEPIQGNLRGKVLDFLEIRPRLINQHQPGVVCYKHQAELFGHSIQLLRGPGSIMIRLPEAVVTSHTNQETVVVGISHTNHDYIEIEIPDARHYLYLYHPWPQIGRD